MSGIRSSEACSHIVAAFYRGFLEREPDQDGLTTYVEALQNGLTLFDLVNMFLTAPEFHAKIPGRLNLYPLDGAPRLEVELDLSAPQRRLLWEKVARTWSALGTADPYWSVITNDRYKIAHMSRSGAIDEFYETGWNELSRLTAWLDRSGCSVSGDATCVDYGCGVGRATLWLARTFKRVIAVDVSESHLKAAQDYLGRQGIKNVEFHLLRSEQDLERVKGADVFFSVIVLQHNPPPMIAHILQQALEGLASDGVAFFQVPSYMLNYRFKMKSYMKSLEKEGGMEMHLLPQSEVFKLAGEAGCDPLEVQPDWLTGMWGAWISNTYLFRKRRLKKRETKATWWRR